MQVEDYRLRRDQRLLPVLHTKTIGRDLFLSKQLVLAAIAQISLPISRTPQAIETFTRRNDFWLSAARRGGGRLLSPHSPCLGRAKRSQLRVGGGLLVVKGVMPAVVVVCLTVVTVTLGGLAKVCRAGRVSFPSCCTETLASNAPPKSLDEQRVLDARSMTMGFTVRPQTWPANHTYHQGLHKRKSTLPPPLRATRRRHHKQCQAVKSCPNCQITTFSFSRSNSQLRKLGSCPSVPNRAPTRHPDGVVRIGTDEKNGLRRDGRLSADSTPPRSTQHRRPAHTQIASRGSACRFSTWRPAVWPCSRGGS